MPTTSFFRKAVYPLLDSTQNAVKIAWPCQQHDSGDMRAALLIQNYCPALFLSIETVSKVQWQCADK